MKNNNQIFSSNSGTELTSSSVPENDVKELPVLKPEETESDGKIVFEFNKKTIKYITATVVFIVLLIWGLNNSEKVSGIIGSFFSLLAPFITGFCFAFIINVLMRPLERFCDRIFKKNKSNIKNKIKRC